MVEGAALGPTVNLGVIGVSHLEPGSVDRASIDLTATYRVEATLGWTSRKLTVSTAIAVLNTSGGPIDRLELNAIAARLGGGMVIDRVSIDGRAGTASVDDQTITVPLGGILPEGQRTLVQLVYRATLRSDTSGSNWLFSKANGVVNLYRWIPWISRPVAFDRPNHGDPFVTPVSPRVQVTLIADQPLVVATGGHETLTEDGGRRRTFVATDVRDLALTAAPDYTLTSTIVDGVIVKVYGRPGDPTSTYRNEARLALQRFGPLVGSYPWTSLTVARSGGGFAMESPGMVWIPPGASNLAYLVHHEIAHQWFYGLVGNDQTDEPFADEAATDFLTRYVLKIRRASSCSTDDLDDPIYAYSEACYYEVIYIQGGNFLDDLRKQVGSTVFWTGLRTYIDDHRFSFGGTKALLDAIDAASQLDLVPVFRPRFDRYY